VQQDLTYARGLEPVTLLEVQHIEFQRRRHIVTSSLPPATDEASLRLRKRILENLELQVRTFLSDPRAESIRLVGIAYIR
jgi:hypothetical protein